MIFKIYISLHLWVSQVLQQRAKYLVFPQGIGDEEGGHKEGSKNQKNPFNSSVIVYQEYTDKTQVSLGKFVPETHLGK